MIRVGVGRLFKLQASLHGHVRTCPHYAKNNSNIMSLFSDSLNKYSMEFANG